MPCSWTLTKAWISEKPLPRQRVFPLPGDDSDILLFLRKKRKGWARTLIRLYFTSCPSGRPLPVRHVQQVPAYRAGLFPELERLKIGSITSKNSYALDGLFDEEQTTEFRRSVLLGGRGGCARSTALAGEAL